MNTARRIAAIVGAVVLALPFAASAQLYYYAPNTTSGAFNYGSSQGYIPSAAMPYVQMGQQIQQQTQQQYGGYSYPGYSSYSYPSQTQYQSQSQSQYQTSPYQYGSYSQPTYQYSQPSYGYGYSNYQITPTMLGEQGGEYAYMPQTYSYPSGTTGPFGQQLCYYSDSTTYEPCGYDPQQWVQDPYTGGWY